jgi:hypothetical protein
MKASAGNGLSSGCARSLEKPDWQVAAYAMALALLGIVVLPWLKAGEHGVVQGRSTFSNALVVLQLAFAVLLLTSAGLGYRSLSLISRLDLGFNADHLLLVSVNTAGSAATPDANRALLERLRDREVPGVGSVSHVQSTSGWEGVPIRLPAHDAGFLIDDPTPSTNFAKKALACDSKRAAFHRPSKAFTGLI